MLMASGPGFVDGECWTRKFRVGGETAGDCAASHDHHPSWGPTRAHPDRSVFRSARHSGQCVERSDQIEGTEATRARSEG